VNPSETREARVRLYALLASLVTNGPSPSALRVARELPALAALGDGDPDDLAAGHHAALSLASASAFLSPDGLAGGPPPDQLGEVLLELARREAGSADPSGTAALLDRTLSWLPLLVLAVRTVREPAWSSVVELALELCASHRAELPSARVAVEPAAPAVDLDAAETSLRTLGASLCRPACSGWMPTSAALSRLAAAAELPGGFGDRAERLTGLLYAAADAGRLPVLCDALASLLVGWASDLRAFDRTLEIPLRSWADRAEGTASAVTRVGKAASG
jgi:hypothetical protein